MASAASRRAQILSAPNAERALPGDHDVRAIDLNAEAVAPRRQLAQVAVDAARELPGLLVRLLVGGLQRRWPVRHHEGGEHEGHGHLPTFPLLVDEVLAAVPADEHVPLDLDAAAMKVTHGALHAALEDSVRNQQDDRARLRALLDRMPGEHDVRAIDLDAELRRRRS